MYKTAKEQDKVAKEVERLKRQYKNPKTKEGYYRSNPEQNQTP